MCFNILFLATFNIAGAQNSWDPGTVRKEKKLVPFQANIDSLVCNNASLRGSVVFINFWFAGCPPCISELEDLNRLYEKLRHKKNFQFISFSFDSSKTIEMMIDLYKIKYPVFRMDKEDVKKLNFGHGFPVNFIVDRDGYVVYTQYSGGNKKVSSNIINKEIYPAVLRFIDLNNKEN